MRILICDDEPECTELLCTHIKEYMSIHCIECEITLTQDPQIIMNSDTSYDLAFLDIQMGQIDGISLARWLKQCNSKVALFFVTNYYEYQDDAMDLQAFRYFEKPFDISRLHAGLDRAMEYIDGAYLDVYLSGDGVQRRVLVDDIMYVMRDNRRVILVTKNGSFSIKETFDQCCAKLPSLFFFRVHNSFFVNLHYVNEYSYSELILSNGERISIASRKQANFRKFWFESPIPGTPHYKAGVISP